VPIILEEQVVEVGMSTDSFGKTVSERLSELKHESFDFLEAHHCTKMEEDVMNTTLIVSVTRREGLQIGAQSTLASNDKVTTSIVKKFKNTHSVVDNM
jgi:hypothetical protein